LKNSVRGVFHVKVPVLLASVECRLIPPNRLASEAEQILSQRLAHTLFCSAALVALGNAAAGELREQVERAAQQNFAEYLDALRIPNVPAQPADLQRNAELLSRAFERRGFDVRLVTNPAGKPVVLAELAPRPGLPTVLFYFHYDGQPVVSSDPFVPVVRRRNAAGEWQDVGAEILQAWPFDPEFSTDRRTHPVAQRSCSATAASP
jgi:hypothetical protein